MTQSRLDQPLTPEEESIGDPEDDGDIDDSLPSDLWFTFAAPRCPSGRSSVRTQVHHHLLEAVTEPV